MIMRKTFMIALIIFSFLAAFLNFLPHLNYQYPIHVDEYVHYQYASHLSLNSPQYFGETNLSLEHGFHIILAILNSLGIPYLSIFNILPFILTIFISLSLFIITRRIFNTESALFSVLFFVLLRSTASILGPMFLVPMSIGLLLILTGLYLLEINSNLFFLPLASLLIIHPPSALAYFIIININLILKRKNILKNISLQALAFLIALPLYIPTFMQKGLNTVNNLSFTSIISPLFIPRFIGYFIIIIFTIGLYFTSLKKRYDLISYIFAFLLIILLFYKFNIEFFVPYARTLFYLFIIIAIIFGYGCYNLTNTKNKKLKPFLMILLILVILSFSLLIKLNSTGLVYHIIENKDYQAFQFIKENTPTDSIVLADPWISNALTPIAERQVFSRITQGPNAFYEQRNKEITTFFQGNCTNLSFLKANNISVIYGNCNNSDLKEIYPKVFSLS